MCVMDMHSIKGWAATREARLSEKRSGMGRHIQQANRICICGFLFVSKGLLLLHLVHRFTQWRRINLWFKAPRVQVPFLLKKWFLTLFAELPKLKWSIQKMRNNYCFLWYRVWIVVTDFPHKEGQFLYWFWCSPRKRSQPCSVSSYVLSVFVSG